MNEKEIVRRQLKDRQGITFGKRLVFEDVAFSLFKHCLIFDDICPIKCAKELLIADPTGYESLINVLSEFPEFEKEIKLHLEKLLVLL